MIISYIFSEISVESYRRIPKPGISPVFFILCLFISVVLPVQFTSAQISSPDTKSPKTSESTFNQIFDQEIEKYSPAVSDNKNRKPLKSSFPAWLPSRFPVLNDTLYVVGISDPGLLENLAREQAIQRGCALAVLSRYCTGKFLSDYYIKSKNLNTGSKYEEMYLFSASIHLNPDTYKVVQLSKLRSKEVIVLLAIPVSGVSTLSADIFQVSGFLYNYDLNSESHNNLLRKISFGLMQANERKTKITTDSISFYQVNNRFTGIQNLQQKFFPGEKRYDYFYSSFGSQARQSSMSKPEGSSCKSGLWIALLNQVFEQLSYFVTIQANQTQSVQDQTFIERNELNREKSSVSLSFSIREFAVFENNLSVKMDISHEK